ncbi:hypothetical protein O5O45_19435 [Hahella aquimaris]|uniref:hypothetical protein n=1 Tax=Hahella sp. HNIBRBA332 TaxID=3015983 RepID=UPI00273AECB6|nr:hypothetical protein [Hahella sp. HNIBRBA332]WLQ11904.1 hypothetical protein O5O45_19435 [Hahella sp. HNIBRBA332]
MTNERIWQSLVNFLSGLGGTYPVSMIYDTQSYMPAVEEYLSNLQVGEDISKTKFYLDVFWDEYINQNYSGYWKHTNDHSVVMVGLDEDGWVYKTTPSQISIEKVGSCTSFEVNPFDLASKYLSEAKKIVLSGFVNEYIKSKA